MVDERIQVLKRSWFHNLRVLDVGCNVGNVTFEIGREINHLHLI